MAMNPSIVSAGKMVYRFPRTKTTFFCAGVFLGEYPYNRDKLLSSLALSSRKMS